MEFTFVQIYMPVSQLTPVPMNNPPALPVSLNLALIGNCAVSALVSQSGVIQWACLPRFDSPPLLHGLLDSAQGIPEQGQWAIELEDQVDARQHYLPGTAVLVTELRDRQGQGIAIHDFAPRFDLHGRVFRPAQLVRRVRPLNGRPRIRVVFTPVGDWGLAPAQLTRGSNHVRYVLGDQTWRLNTNAPVTYVAQQTCFSLQEPVSFLFGPDETLSGDIEETARHFEEQTTQHWREWTRRLAIPLMWQDAVIRSAITLKLCQFEETGAIVAAMTTSIPEAPNSGRNWDYRYCWLRDAFFVVRALNSLSEVGTMERYLHWMQNVVAGARDGHIQPLYGIGLEQPLTESTLDHLSGYRGMGPVRQGNQAFEHFQHDVYGNIILGAAQAFHDKRLFRQADATDFHHLQAVGEQAWRLHDQPDAGMWELRSRARVHTSSSLMCWAACDRLAKIAHALGLQDVARHWAGRAEVIHGKITEQSWNHQRQAFVESFGGKDLDASVLLMAEVGFIDARDPRFVATVDALETHLCDGPYMRRYEAADDFGKPETSFNVCSFWRVDALARIGRQDEARALFETLLASRNHVGLLSEDVHPVTGELWGNLPQTYSMVGIINGAVRLSSPWESVI
jgi:GH15 family glucan-1,4-alpha-glucosidase